MPSILSCFWIHPENPGANRLPPRAPLIPFPDINRALTHNRTDTPWYRSLCGVWEFSLFVSPNVAEQALNHGTVTWSTIPVPANWTLENTGDWPIYTNIKMPFDNPPPLTPKKNPTGLYRTTFHLGKKWADRRTVIHFGGVDGSFILSCNGSDVGYHKDSRLPAEFDLTPFVKKGGNELLVKVIRWSDASHIENQDHWWMAGIHREVYLYSTASEYIQDIFAKPLLDENCLDAELAVDVHIGAGEVSKKLITSVRLFDPAGNPVPLKNATQRHQSNPICLTASQPGDHDSNLRFQFPVSAPKQWTPENPALYSLVVTLEDCQSRLLEASACRIGFRRLEIKNRELLLNRQPILIRGVNRHDHDSIAGKVVSRETMLKDIRLLKQFNFNAVRCAHYPNDPHWYDLCDEYGILVMDEANIESHDYYDQLCRDPRYTAAFVDRVQRMVLRDKNHPCIFAWSLGNESGYGPNHDAAAAWIRHIDPNRIVHYEGITREEFGQTEVWFVANRGLIASDLFSPMYPEVEDMIRFVTEVDDPRPYIPCEYSHAMGNSNGSLKEYWNAFKTIHGLQGGFVWDWVDQGLLLHSEKRMKDVAWETPENTEEAFADCKRPGGDWFWGFGGDFDEPYHDLNFCINGLVWPDRTPHPAMFELKKLMQPISAEAIDLIAGKVRICNLYDFSGLQHLKARWELLADGEVIEAGELPPLNIAPGASLELRIPFHFSKLGKNEGHLNLFFQTLKKTNWCEADHTVAWEQFELQPAKKFKSLETRPLTAEFQDGQIVVLHNGQPVLAGLTLNLWRACTDNDGIRGWSGQDKKPIGQWQSAGFQYLDPPETQISQTDELLSIVRNYIGNKHPVILEQTISTKTGVLQINSKITFPTGLPSPARIGIQAQLPSGFEKLEWFGRGPHESYIDRCAGAPVGRYTSTVTDQYVPYILPQEHGNHIDTRWFELSSNKGSLRITSEKPFEFSASHLTAENLYNAVHTNQLEPQKETFITLNAVQRGLGTGACGPQTRPKYCIHSGTYTLNLLITYTSTGIQNISNTTDP